MKEIVKKSHRDREYFIQSAAVSTEELGNPVYPPARRKMESLGINCKEKHAVRMTRSDYNRYDMLICMDDWNLTYMKRICGGDPELKMSKLMDYTKRPGNVSDPWYTDDFDTAWNDIFEGCSALFDFLESRR